MEKQEKAMLAHSNSQRLKAQTPDYTAVDGRVYRLDKKLPSGKPNMRTCAIRVMRDRPSLMDVYRIEHWLSGKGRYGKSYVPAAEKNASSPSMAFPSRSSCSGTPHPRKSCGSCFWNGSVRRFRKSILRATES